MLTKVTAMVEVTYICETTMANDDEAAGALKNAIAASGFTVGVCHVIDRKDIPPESDEANVEF